MKLVTVYLPQSYIKALDQLVDLHFYPCRAEAIRVAIKDLIKDEVWTRTPLPCEQKKVVVSEEAQRDLRKPPSKLIRPQQYPTQRKPRMEEKTN